MSYEMEYLEKGRKKRATLSDREIVEFYQTKREKDRTVIRITRKKRRKT